MSSPGSQGSLYIVSGPSGTGKTSLCAELLKQAPRLRLSISCTTRPARAGEKDGVDYHFLAAEEFEAQKRAGAFLEHAMVHGRCYGTREQDVLEMLGQGLDVLLEIDWQGASQVAAKMPDACRIFILPPSLDVLRERLKGRRQDNDDEIARRLLAAKEEMAHAEEARHCIINDSFDDALHELLDIYRKSKLV